MGERTDHIKKLLSGTGNFEEARGTGIIINCPKLSNSWFDALDDDRRGIKRSTPKESEGVGFNKKRNVETNPDITDIP
jgi:hypothetical protein